MREKLEIEISDKSELNHDFSVLTAPTKPSFLAQEERDLRQIASLDVAEQGKALEEHLRKYFWIQNSYAGAVKLSIDYFKNRLKNISKDSVDVGIDKGELIEKLALSQKTITLLEMIDFTTVWQDERKAHILKSISCLGAVLEILARRTNLSDAIYYLGATEILSLNSVDQLVQLGKTLEERRGGVYFLLENGIETALSGPDYKNLRSQEKETPTLENDFQEIRGWTAQAGKAGGRVVICNGLDSFGKVHDGDILVTAMTRPEFAPILKKVVAIITDEGGITCHAAIVARELKIPCIIGTKNATKILKDGDMVEVDADNGVVRRLQS